MTPTLPARSACSHFGSGKWLFAQPATHVNASGRVLDSHRPRMHMALHMGRQYTLRRDFEEPRINLRVVYIQQSRGAGSRGKRLSPRSQNVRPNFGSLRVIAKEVRDLLRDMGNIRFHFIGEGRKDTVEWKRKGDANPAASTQYDGVT